MTISPDKIKDLEIALDTLKSSPSPAFKRGAAEWIQSLATSILDDIKAYEREKQDSGAI